MPKNKHTNPAYISHVHLKGYKSIIDTEVELHPGLNILIGPNGSGKTNFLEFLFKVTDIKLDDFPQERIEGRLEFYFKNDDNKQTYNFGNYPIQNKITNKIEFRLHEMLRTRDGINIDSTREPDKSVYFFPIPRSLSKWDEIRPVSLNFGLPDTIQNLSQSLSFIVEILNIKGEPNFVYTKYSYNPEISTGVKRILENLSIPMIYERKRLERNFIGIFEIVIRNLKKFSPIESVRIMPSLNLVEDNSKYRADYINFEFLVNTKWLKWNQLSDGTKRLFYIISETTLNEGLCFIEEPEIGVHPDQYRKILTFLKEQAENKQIIITTHAPKTLDILEDDELDRIILTRYDKELGTKMRHLSKEEQNHAVKFMKEESFFLSDFWTLTSFFDEEEEVA